MPTATSCKPIEAAASTGRTCSPTWTGATFPRGEKEATSTCKTRPVDGIPDDNDSVYNLTDEATLFEFHQTEIDERRKRGFDLAIKHLSSTESQPETT